MPFHNSIINFVIFSYPDTLIIISDKELPPVLSLPQVKRVEQSRVSKYNNPDDSKVPALRDRHEPEPELPALCDLWVEPLGEQVKIVTQHVLLVHRHPHAHHFPHTVFLLGYAEQDHPAPAVQEGADRLQEDVALLRREVLELVAFELELVELGLGYLLVEDETLAAAGPRFLH